MGKIIAAVFALLTILGVGLGALFYSGYFDDENDPEFIASEYQVAEKLLNEERGSEALMIIDRYAHLPPQQIQEFHTRGLKWLDLELEALVQTKSIPRLFHLYHRSPETFDKREDVVLSLCVLLVQWQKFEEYEKMRQRWRGKEEKPKIWFLMDGDLLIFQNKPEAAIAHLKTKEFEGKEDIPRLIRLALASTGVDLKVSWAYLSRALMLDPKNAELRSFRAQVLERVDNLKMARFELAAAMIADQDDPNLRDQMAEFYRRHKDYRNAVATWKIGVDKLQSPLMWLKAAFWSRLSTPTDFADKEKSIPEGYLKYLASFVQELPEGKYWDEEAFRKLPEADFFAKHRQEVFWLKLLGSLQEGKEREALEQLETNVFAKASWAPHLENALRQVLRYRLHGELPLALALYHPAIRSTHKEPHVLFYQLNTLSRLGDTMEIDKQMPEETKQLLLGEEVFAALFLAAGWHEAALEFHRLPVIPEDQPDWLAYSLIEAYVANRNIDTALAFAQKQHDTPLVEMMEGELLLAKGQRDQAIPILEKISANNSLLGFRSTLLLSNMYIKEKNFEKAREQVAKNQSFADNLMGKEQLAHLAVLEGKLELADKLYGEIAKESFSAKSYLAKRAYDRGDFAKAKELTLQLIQEQPDILPLRANLREIIEAEKAAMEKAE